MEGPGGRGEGEKIKGGKKRDKKNWSEDKPDILVGGEAEESGAEGEE